MKHHLVGIKKDVIPCCSLLDEAKEIVLNLLRSKEKKERGDQL